LQGERSAAELAAMEHEILARAFDDLAAKYGADLARHFPAALEPPGPLQILTHAQACTRLRLPEGSALSAAHERELGAQVGSQGSAFCAIVDVPWEQRPFYHRRVPSAPHLTISFELLYRGMEITTGAMREHRHAVLLAQLAEKGLSGDGAEGYLRSFEWGAPPHGGFGLGLARLVALHLGLPSIREATFLHRTPKSLTP
jgi:aspartyl/asparaginyl-tRNA synthetase